MLEENIKKYREASSLSQEELAEKLHVVRQTVSKWERGISVPDSNMLVELAEVFNTSVNELLGKEVPPPPQEKSCRKPLRWLFIALLSVSLIFALILIGNTLLPLFYSGTVPSNPNIIGGADAAVDIYVFSNLPEILVCTILAIIGIAGLYFTRSGKS